jgi:hypothetical protein
MCDIAITCPTRLASLADLPRKRGRYEPSLPLWRFKREALRKRGKHGEIGAARAASS